ncbi:hypothetical protein DY245_02315 [Streptomyces inhibens]|uniref:Uncharacterized protein n=1 Tax=Streptomyces inhibens TaxID=2293571 RepID=A0A371QB46_STRIH|nr:hypothetical protein DY245_02315 [Streptomyces inhibens]
MGGVVVDGARSGDHRVGEFLVEFFRQLQDGEVVRGVSKSGVDYLPHAAPASDADQFQVGSGAGGYVSGRGDSSQVFEDRVDGA